MIGASAGHSLWLPHFNLKFPESRQSQEGTNLVRFWYRSKFLITINYRLPQALGRP